MLRTLAEKVDPQHTAVIVVDVQNDFCAPGGGLAALGVDMSMIDACVPRIQRLVAAARDAGARVIHIRTGSVRTFAEIPGARNRPNSACSGTIGDSLSRLPKVQAG